MCEEYVCKYVDILLCIVCLFCFSTKGQTSHVLVSVVGQLALKKKAFANTCDGLPWLH